MFDPRRLYAERKADAFARGLDELRGTAMTSQQKVQPPPRVIAAITAALLYVDGGCSGNDQKDISKRRMVAVVTDAHGRVLSEQTHDGGGSNNIAELLAVRDALAWAARHHLTTVEVRTDSRNNLAWARPGAKVGAQINDRVAVETLQREIAVLRATVRLRLVWVPREENRAGHYIERRHGL